MQEAIAVGSNIPAFQKIAFFLSISPKDANFSKSAGKKSIAQAATVTSAATAPSSQTCDNSSHFRTAHSQAEHSHCHCHDTVKRVGHVMRQGTILNIPFCSGEIRELTQIISFGAKCSLLYCTLAF